MVPAKPATIKFNIIANAITIPNNGSENQYEDKKPTKKANIIPFIPPTKVSLIIIVLIIYLTEIYIKETGEY